MCFGKFFGGSRRHRSRAVPDGGSMRSSLANVPQLSVDNVRPVKSSRSIKSANAAAASAASRGTFNVGNQMAPSVNTMGSEARKSVATGGAAASDIPTSVSMVPNTGGPAGGSVAAISNVRSVRRSSWWGFLGMNKKKNSSIGSL